MYEAEKIIFEMVNSYRVSQGLKEVSWSDDVYNAAYHHSSYMSNEGVEFEHTERVDVEGHEEINDVQERIRKYCGDYAWGTECMAGLPLISFSNEPFDLKEACWEVVSSWISSPGHRKAMLFDLEGNGNLQFGAVSVIKVKYCESSVPVLVLTNKVD
tara:strand:- start:811 stop:1281 length:471 start_codon:yes stop_codon:yes gene_type:complete